MLASKVVRLVQGMLDHAEGTLRWGLVSPASSSVCLHCGRDLGMHAGACWNEPLGRFLDGARAV